MLEKITVQADLQALCEQPVHCKDPANPRHWRRVLRELTDLCCVNSKNFKKFAEAKAKRNLKHHYFVRAQLWLDYAYQASDAIQLLDEYPQLTAIERQAIAKKLRALHGSSLVATAIERGQMDLYKLSLSELNQPLPSSVVAEKSNRRHHDRHAAVLDQVWK